MKTGFLELGVDSPLGIDSLMMMLDPFKSNISAGSDSETMLKIETISPGTISVESNACHEPVGLLVELFSDATFALVDRKMLTRSLFRKICFNMFW